MNNLDLTNDDLEEQGLVECCSMCTSLHITIETGSDGSSINLCNNCGTVDYTEVITEKEYQEKMKLAV